MQQLSLFQPEAAPRWTPKEKQSAALEAFAPDNIVSAQIAYQAMMEALRNLDDPMSVTVRTERGADTRLWNCRIIGLGGVEMSRFSLLKMARADHDDEMRAAQAEIDSIVSDNWSM